MISRRSLLAGLASAAFGGPGVDLLVQGAVDTELGPLLAALEGKQLRRVSAWSFWKGHMGRRQVVVSRTDVGPVNASASTALGIREFGPKAIINQGTAGAHSRALKLWDIVLGVETTDYAAFQSSHADQGAGQDPGRWKPLPHPLRVDGEKVQRFPTFPGDARLLAAAEKLTNPRGRVVRGNIGSAFQFNREVDRLDWAHQVYGTDAEDMESAYAAGVAVAMKVPFAAVRMISDTEWEHPNFERIAGQYCAEFVVELIRSL
jgi:adenosylhomocysteine nucleosidase